MNDENKPKKHIRKLTIDIVDQEALLAAYPALKIVIQQELVDRKKLRPIVNALHEVGATVPGVHAYYASEESAVQEDDSAGSIPNKVA